MTADILNFIAIASAVLLIWGAGEASVRLVNYIHDYIADTIKRED